MLRCTIRIDELDEDRGNLQLNGNESPAEFVMEEDWAFPTTTKILLA